MTITRTPADEKEIDDLAFELFITTYGMTRDQAMQEAIRQINHLRRYAIEWDTNVICTTCGDEGDCPDCTPGFIPEVTV